MTAQAFAVGDRVEIVGPRWDGNTEDEGRTGQIDGPSYDGLMTTSRVYPVDLGTKRGGAFPPSILRAIPAPLPPTEDVLSALLVEQRKTNDLLTQLLARPTLTLHGQERDWQAQDDYSGSLACRVAARHGTPATDPYRPNRGPQAEQ